MLRTTTSHTNGSGTLAPVLPITRGRVRSQPQESGSAARTAELLAAKLQRPRLPRQFLPRSRLIERLDQGARGPLTLVCAAAGYGKTTLVSSWIEGKAAGTGPAAERPVVWISLDERDSDLGLFLRYLIAGLRTVFPTACPATADLLQVLQHASRELLYATFSNELARLQDFILVLDDHHAITGTAVPDLFRRLEQHWPQPLHLVLISRYVPALALANLRAKGWLTEIRTRDLRFTPGETAAYLERTLHRPVSRSTVELLERRAEGWIAGLQLAALSLDDAEDPEGLLAGLSGSDAAFADYLADDVLSRQPAVIQSFLFQTAVLDRFCAAMCETVIALENPACGVRQCIDWLEQHNLFVTAMHGHKQCYRYHPMFRDMLQQRARAELGSTRVRELQRRAASWSADQGAVEEALQYALAAGDLELAARFVDRGLCEVLNRDDRPTLERWLRLFSEDYVQSRADLLLIKAVSLNITWQPGALRRILQRAALMFETGASAALEPGAGTWRGLSALLAASVAYSDNDLNGAIDLSREALALLPEAWSYARGGAMFYQALAMQAAGQGQDALRLLIESYEDTGDRVSPYALRLLLALCGVYYEQGDLERVTQTAQKLSEGAERHGLRILQAWGLYLRGLSQYQRNDLAAARPCFAALRNYRDTGEVTALRDGLQRLALIHATLGEQAEAWQTLQDLTELDLEQMGREADDTGALRARLWLIGGQVDRAAAWADTFTTPIAVPGLPTLDPPHLVQAQALIARGTQDDVQRALEILTELYEVAQRRHAVPLQTQVMARRALALGRQPASPSLAGVSPAAAGGEKGVDARAALLAAIDLARTGRFLRVFLDLGPGMREALGQLYSPPACLDRPSWNSPHGGAGQAACALVRQILAGFDHEAGGAMPGVARGHGAGKVLEAELGSREVKPEPLIEPLTHREVEILLLLRDPLSVKEIAGRLFISYGTARRHTMNIYGKLDVNKRWDAVAKGEALGLLPRR